MFTDSQVFVSNEIHIVNDNWIYTSIISNGIANIAKVNKDNPTNPLFCHGAEWCVAWHPMLAIIVIRLFKPEPYEIEELPMMCQILADTLLNFIDEAMVFSVQPSNCIALSIFEWLGSSQYPSLSVLMPELI